MRYQTILIDPPWNETGGGKIKRGADRHYPLMKTHDIIRTILNVDQWKGISDHAHLYLWVTNNFLEDGLFLMKAIGFKYKTNIVWTKDRMGLGQYFRGQHEICLFGTKGTRPTQPRTDDRSISSLVSAPRGKHSKKPEVFYDLIERRSHGPYLEMFARSKRIGWSSWGNEITS